ncbi:unnamed protein product [Caenorhabditis auriculariae]|uniref:BRO1 domain-containing protein n=1 Tax=Caenorhabditis auriculariae TaxID=2777116 RepID=A0A8S1HLC7_9PELO|nr:unnamed protein product [Caenorhabditis auriculariae]
MRRVIKMSGYGFLCVPLKSTNEVDLVKPLTTYIDTVYNTSDDNRAEVTEAVQELNKLRSKACCQPLDKHQSALDVITRYYDQLVAIENKIVISATQNPVVFKWKDAFDKGSLFSSRAALSLSDGSFERASVLFNCGALMSQIAGTQQFNTDEEIKTAAKLFQQSAGVYAKLRDTILGMVQQDPTPDLMPDTLAALSALMVAQAQEAIYIKGHKDKMKPAAMVKIGAQVADFYAEAQKLMTKDIVKGLWEKEWLSTVNGKNLAYQALSQFHQAELNGENREIGEQLSRLSEAIKLSETASKYLPAGGSNAITDLFPAISKAHTLAKKDNDFIYHERVADFRSLGSLPKAPLAKPTPVTYPISPRFKDMFESLVPVQVHNAMQSYEARKAELVNMETVRLREHTQLMNGILASLNLPAALDDVTSNETLPESIKQKSSKIKQEGGATEIQRLFSEIPSLYTRNEEIINETSRVLTEEKESDDNLRRQFGTKWNRMSSDQLTGPLLQEIGKYRGILHTASNADKMVDGKFKIHQQGITLLSKNEVELKSAIPGQQGHSNNGQSESVQKLRQLMSEVQEITTEREQLEKELKSTNCDIANDFLKAMGESQILNEEQISREKIQQLFGPLKSRVEASVKRQDQVMAQVQTWNSKFASEKSGSASGAERERILKMLAQAADAFLELKANLQEGTKFYNDLTPILVRLQQKVNDFSFARQTEKEDLMRQLQINIVAGAAAKTLFDNVGQMVAGYVTGGAGGNTGGASTPTAPPRPPPPRPSQPNVESPIPPPRNVQSLQAVPGAPPQQQPQQQQYNPYQPQAQNPQMNHPGYYQHPVPYGQPQPQQYMFQPNYQPTFAAPYPTFPGAFPSYQQQQWPQQQQQQQGFPPNPTFNNPQQQPPHNTNPFQELWQIVKKPPDETHRTRFNRHGEAVLKTVSPLRISIEFNKKGSSATDLANQSYSTVLKGGHLRKDSFSSMSSPTESVKSQESLSSAQSQFTYSTDRDTFISTMTAEDEKENLEETLRGVEILDDQAGETTLEGEEDEGISVEELDDEKEEQLGNKDNSKTFVEKDDKEGKCEEEKKKPVVETPILFSTSSESILDSLSSSFSNCVRFEEDIEASKPTVLPKFRPSGGEIEKVEKKTEEPEKKIPEKAVNIEKRVIKSEKKNPREDSKIEEKAVEQKKPIEKAVSKNCKKLGDLQKEEARKAPNSSQAPQKIEKVQPIVHLALVRTVHADKLPKKKEFIPPPVPQQPRYNGRWAYPRQPYRPENNYNYYGRQSPYNRDRNGLFPTKNGYGMPTNYRQNTANNYGDYPETFVRNRIEKERRMIDQSTSDLRDFIYQGEKELSVLKRRMNSLGCVHEPSTTLRATLKEVRAAGGIHSVDDKVAFLRNSYSTAMVSLKKVEEIIRFEKESIWILQKKFACCFPILPSPRLDHYAQGASKSRAEIEDIVTLSSSLIRHYETQRPAFKKILEFEELRECANRLEQVIEEAGLIVNLKIRYPLESEEQLTYDFRRFLRQSRLPPLHPECEMFFDLSFAQNQRNISHQVDAIVNFEKEFERLKTFKAPRADFNESTNSSSIREAMYLFVDMYNRIRAGVKFYEESVGVIEALKENVEDLSAASQRERDEISRDLQPKMDDCRHRGVSENQKLKSLSSNSSGSSEYSTAFGGSDQKNEKRDQFDKEPQRFYTKLVRFAPQDGPRPVYAGQHQMGGLENPEFGHKQQYLQGYVQPMNPTPRSIRSVANPQPPSQACDNRSCCSNDYAAPCSSHAPPCKPRKSCCDGCTEHTSSSRQEPPSSCCCHRQPTEMTGCRASPHQSQQQKPAQKPMAPQPSFPMTSPTMDPSQQYYSPQDFYSPNGRFPPSY